MKTYSGTVKLIGAGTWATKGNSGGTTVSVLEIGDHTFKKIGLTDYLSNFLHTGDDVRILVYRTLLHQGT